jgi:mono/diheme cytochrome c family protein
MNFVVGFFKALKYIILVVLSFLILGVFFLRLVEWGLLYKVVQPKAEDIAYELTTYVEANEVRLTDDVLKSFMESWKEDGYIDDHEEVRIRYIQYANDKRFKVHVTVNASFWDRTMWVDGWSELQGINWAAPPVNTVAGHYPSYDDGDKEVRQIAASKVEPEKTEKAEAINTLKVESEEPKEEKSQSKKISDESIRSFMKHYVVAGLAAIDYNDFSMVVDLLDPNGKAYKESKSYIQHMDEIEMQQELLEMEVTRIAPFNTDGFKVTTTEEYRIIDSEDTDKIKRYQSDYHLVLLIDGKLAMRELLKTDLLSSVEVDAYVGGNTDFYVPEDESMNRADPYYYYQQMCAGCHGNNYEGVSGPPLYNVGNEMDEEKVKNILIYGSDNGNMPPMLNESDAETMAAFLMELY